MRVQPLASPQCRRGGLSAGACELSLYLPGSIPWILMTFIGPGLVRAVISSFAASIDWDLALMPPVNVMYD